MIAHPHGLGYRDAAVTPSVSSNLGLSVASTDLLAAPIVLPVILALAWLLPAGPFTAIAVILLLVSLVSSPPLINWAAFRLVVPFLVMTAWGLAMGIGHDRYDLLKDLWYALKLATCLMLGFSLGVRTADSRKPLAGFVLFAFASAAWSIVTWRSSSGNSLDTVGLQGFEHLSLASVAALPILYWRAKEERGTPQLVHMILGLVIVFAVILSASRTTIVSAGIMMLAAVGLFSSWRRMILAALLAAGAMYLAYLLLPADTGGPLTLAVKFRRSLDEILFTDSTDPRAMIMNWRGFEAYNAQLLFEQSSALRKLFGNGFGTLVDLGVEIRNNDGTIVRFQPILHNGYFHIIVKYGLFGVVAYIATLLWYAFVGRRSADASAHEDRLLRGLIASILFATLVVTGLYNKDALQDMTILLAWLVGQGCRNRFEALLRLQAPEEPAQAQLYPA